MAEGMPISQHSADKPEMQKMKKTQMRVMHKSSCWELDFGGLNSTMQNLNDATKYIISGQGVLEQNTLELKWKTGSHNAYDKCIGHFY